MHSFSRRLTRRIVLALMLTLILINAGIFYQASQISGTMASAYFGHVADIENEKVEKWLHGVEVAVNNSIDEVEWQLGHPDSVYVALEDKLKLNPRDVLGFGVAFEADYYPEKGRWFLPYAMWLYGKIVTMQNGSAQRDYFEKEWYLEGMAHDEGYWSDPYAMEVGNDKMYICTFSKPIRNPQGRKVGAFGGDLSLEMLHQYLLEKDLKANTEGPLRTDSQNVGDPSKWVRSIVVGKNGYYIAHPDRQRILRDNFFREVTQQPDTAAERMVGDMKASRNGVAHVRVDGVPSTVFYTRLEHTGGWSLAVVLPDNRFLTEVTELCIVISVIMLLGLLAVYIISRITINRATRPLSALAKSADELARGNFCAPLPAIRHNDEIRQLRDSFSNMQQSLSRYVEELKTATAQKSAIESELAIARNIQLSMLPATFPERRDISLCATLTPAKAVGGDFYDYYICGNHLYFCIGDVSGKGVPAALIMATARGYFRLLAEQAADPLAIVGNMNDRMAGNTRLSVFITLFVGVLNLDTGHLRYCNAGHKAPRVDGTRLPVKSNLPVGAMTGWTFEAQETSLAPGAMLFLYTDGLNEAEDAQLNQFGNERMNAVLQSASQSPEALIEGMRQAVADFVGDNEQNDDLTMVAIQWKKQTQ